MLKTKNKVPPWKQAFYDLLNHDLMYYILYFKTGKQNAFVKLPYTFSNKKSKKLLIAGINF